MCIRDRAQLGQRICLFQQADLIIVRNGERDPPDEWEEPMSCLLYTSDAADDLLCVDLGGRRIIKKKNNRTNKHVQKIDKNDYQPTIYNDRLIVNSTT